MNDSCKEWFKFNFENKELTEENFNIMKPKCKHCSKPIEYNSHYIKVWPGEKKFFFHWECYNSLTKHINIRFSCSRIEQYNETLVVIESPTNCIYEFQVGGELCLERKIEGFTIGVNPKWKVIDDCREGFCGCNVDECGFSSPEDDEIIKDTKEYRKKFSKIVAEKLNNVVDEKIKIIFDSNRADEIRESWWPVIVDWNGQKSLKGYLTGWNCH